MSLRMQFAWLRFACDKNKMNSGIKEKMFDSSTLVYTRLVTRLHSYSDSSTLVYVRLHLSVTRLHSSTLTYTRLVKAIR